MTSLRERFRRWRYDPYPDLAQAHERFVKEFVSSPGLNAGHSYFKSMVLYATVGRDRRRLGPEWVAEVDVKARELTREMATWAEELA